MVNDSLYAWELDRSMQEEVVIDILKDIKINKTVVYSPKMSMQTEFKALQEHKYVQIFSDSDQLVVGLTPMGQYALMQLSEL